MSDNTDLRQKLLETVKNRDTQVKKYIQDIEQRSTRLTNMSIICTAVTAVLTAGPAMGREAFTGALSSIFNVKDSAIWGILCLLAMILSIAAAIITNMLKARDNADRLSKAQTARILLDRLAASLEFEQLPVPDASKQYEQYIAEIPFIP